MDVPRVVLVALAGLTLSSCGGDNENGGDHGRAGVTPTIPTGRREAPPAGVAEQVSYYEIGDGGCPTESAGPAIRPFGGFPVEGEVEIGRPHFVICLLGFSAQRPVDVVVRRPDGREVRSRVPAGRAAVRWVHWLPLPNDPLGRYTVEARQGPSTAAGSFTVRAASSPRVVVVEEALGRDIAPGSSVHVVLAGFRPRAAVSVPVYRNAAPGSERFTYLTSLTARTDEHGQAVRTVRVDRRSPAATYLVRVSEDVKYPIHVGP